MSNPSLYPHQQYLRQRLLEAGVDLEHPFVAPLLAALGEYEHGSADVVDIGAGFGVEVDIRQYAAVLEDAILTVLFS